MATASAAFAARIGNAWHIPDNAEPIGLMRQPLAQIFPATNVSIFSGNQFQGLGNPGNQLEAGSTVFFKKTTADGWSSQSMSFHSVNGNNKYFAATLAAGDFNAGDVVEYYLKIPYGDHLTTFLHGTDSSSVATDAEAEAQ